MITHHTLSIVNQLKQLETFLKPISQTARLDAELLLIKNIHKTRQFLYAYPEKRIDKKAYSQLQKDLKRRLKGEPMAYLLGYQEFWSLKLKVTPNTLIPRPETERLVEYALDNFDQADEIRVADLGTGSGAIAIALAKERPKWQIDATDVSKKALAIAQENSQTLNIKNIKFHLNDLNGGSWCLPLGNQLYDAIISNPPYIDKNDTALDPFVLQYEPKDALLAKDNGFSELKKIIHEAIQYLKPTGYLILEHGINQAETIRDSMEKRGYQSVITHLDLKKYDRFTVGKRAC